MANIGVSVLNQSTVLTDTQVQSAIPALQTQVHRDFAPVYGIDADLIFLPKKSTPSSDSWMLAIFDNTDQAGALGYHDLTMNGMPLAKVFAESDIKNGLSWTVTASHELLEMLGDPDIDLTVFVQSSNTSGILYAYEVCDACESDSFGYDVDGILVSDFVFPAWFESFRGPGSVQFDQQKRISKPFEILQDGYIGTFGVTAGSGWQQTTLKSVSKIRVDSRHERRKKPKDMWKRSVT